MNLRKLVTLIVVEMALCLMLSLPAEAAATTKATTKATVSTQLQKNSVKIAKKAKKKAKKKYSETDLRYMTAIIYCEAQGESYQGKKAVGIVVMNRVRSDKFPNTVKKVIYQSGQFSPVRNGSLDKALNLYSSFLI